MRVLITGAGGQLGIDVVRCCNDAGDDVTAASHGQLDIGDRDAVLGALTTVRPDVVVNCAAWTAVDACESDPARALADNGLAVRWLAEGCHMAGARLVQISTDYVFDGLLDRPYVESDTPSPQSVYGSSKLAGETSVAVSNPRHFIVRASWLFGIGGKNFVETMLRLGNERPEVLVVSDQVGSPTYTRHLGEGLAELMERDEFGIHHMAAEGRCSWYEFAQEIFDQAGVECHVMSGTTEMLARPAPRPAFSVLATERPDPIRLPHWRQGLAEYLAEREAAKHEVVA